MKTGITQESKSAIRCWCYGQHQHCNNPCHGNVPHRPTVSRHTDELCEFSAPLRPRIARYLATGALSDGALVPTAMGHLCPRARAKWKVPLGLRIWRKGGPSKVELAIGLLSQAQRRGLQPAYVLCDSW